MIVNSAFNEGLAGMQQSQKRLQQAAHDTVKAGLPPQPSEPTATALGGVPSSNFGTSVNDLPATSTVEAAGAGYKASQSPNSTSDEGMVGPLLQQMQQQLLFDASANVVKAANSALGHLIDDMS